MTERNRGTSRLASEPVPRLSRKSTASRASETNTQGSGPSGPSGSRSTDKIPPRRASSTAAKRPSAVGGVASASATSGSSRRSGTSLAPAIPTAGRRAAAPVRAGASASSSTSDSDSRPPTQPLLVVGPEPATRPTVGSASSSATTASAAGPPRAPLGENTTLGRGLSRGGGAGGGGAGLAGAGEPHLLLGGGAEAGLRRGFLAPRPPPDGHAAAEESGPESGRSTPRVAGGSEAARQRARLGAQRLADRRQSDLARAADAGRRRRQAAEEKQEEQNRLRTNLNNGTDGDLTADELAWLASEGMTAPAHVPGGVPGGVRGQPSASSAASSSSRAPTLSAADAPASRAPLSDRMAGGRPRGSAADDTDSDDGSEGEGGPGPGAGAAGRRPMPDMRAFQQMAARQGMPPALIELLMGMGMPGGSAGARGPGGEGAEAGAGGPGSAQEMMLQMLQAQMARQAQEAAAREAEELELALAISLSMSENQPGAMPDQDMSYETLSQLEDVKKTTPQHIVDSLPSRMYNPSRASENQDACSICLVEYEGGDDIISLRCDHCYHADCIREWLSTHSRCCPICKHNVSEAE